MAFGDPHRAFGRNSCGDCARHQRGLVCVSAIDALDLMPVVRVFANDALGNFTCRARWWRVESKRRHGGQKQSADDQRCFRDILMLSHDRTFPSIGGQRPVAGHTVAGLEHVAMRWPAAMIIPAKNLISPIPE